MFYRSASLVTLTKPRKGFQGVLYYYDEDGKRKRKTTVLKAANKSEAKRQLAQWRAEMEAEAEREAAQAAQYGGLRASATVPEYVAGMIDRLEASKAIEASTVAGYRSTLKHITGAFSDVAVKDLTAAEVQEWEAALTRRGLSSSTVGKAHRLLKQAMKEAVNLDLIVKNPLDAVKPPKRVLKNPGINALDLEGRTRLLDALDAMELTQRTLAARIALYTGLREGEVCGLRWCDVDLEGRTMHIRQAIGTGAGGEYVKQTKTDKTRDIAIPEGLAAILERWRATQQETLTQAEAILSPMAYVMTGTEKNWNLTALCKQWRALAKDLGIKGTEGRIPTYHDLRHTWATMAVAAGADIKTVAGNLGHSNSAITLNVYASPDPDARRKVADQVNDAIRAPKDAALPFKKREA